MLISDCSLGHSQIHSDITVCSPEQILANSVNQIRELEESLNASLIAIDPDIENRFHVRNETSKIRIDFTDGHSGYIVRDIDYEKIRDSLCIRDFLYQLKRTVTFSL